MLRCNKAREPEYYLQPDCPTADGQIEVRQFGNAAKLLNIKDGFRPLEFLRLAKGLNPESGSQLTARLSKNRVEAMDVTVTVPKEVSFAIEVMQDKRVKDVLWEANRYMLGLVEKGAYVRERKGGKGRVYGDHKTGNIAVSSFYHSTTRPIADQGPNHNKPDPHGHIHNYIYNITHDKSDPKKPWKAVKLPHPKTWRDIELKMHKHLAKGLRGIGYDAHVKNGQLEVRGFDKDVMDLYGRRGKESREFAERYTNAKSKGNAGRKTRQEKAELPKDLTQTDLHRNWVSRMTKGQFDKAVDVVSRSQKKIIRQKWAVKVRNHLTKFRSYATQREVPERGRDGIGR